MMTNQPLTRYLDTVGDGSGTKNAIGNYASAAEEFKLVPPVDKVFEVERLIVSVSDVGNFDSGAYGNAISLTNGIEVFKKEGASVVADLTDGLPIITNADWTRVCYDVQVLNFGSGNVYLSVRWTFSKFQTIFLSGNEEESLVVQLNDDLSGLTAHYFHVQGSVREAQA